MRNLRARSRGLLVCDLGYLLGLVGLAGADDADTAEAFTVLGAALASAGGAEIGHGTGEPGGGDRHRGFHVALWVSTLLAVGLAIGLAVGGARGRERMTAALTLILAAVAVASVHHGHEAYVRRFKATADEVLGWAFVVGAVVCGLVGVLAWPEQADTAAMLAAALVTAGGTLVGHARGAVARARSQS